MAFFPFLGHIHLLDWDEINFALSSREMIESANYLQVTVNGEPFWEKPPMFFWLQTVSFTLFDNIEFAARFVSALAGFLTTLLIFFMGRQIISPRFGLIWGLLYSGSALSLFISKMGIMDPTLNLFVLSGIFAYTRMISSTDRSYLYAVLASASLAMAFLIHILFFIVLGQLANQEYQLAIVHQNGCCILFDFQIHWRTKI